MAKHNIALLIAVLLAPVFFIITVTFNALAGQGSYPFLYQTGNISDEFNTQVTPAGWTFSIWSIIYIFLASMMIYILSGLFRKNSAGYMYCSPPVLSHGFYLSWFLNMGLNTGWLFLWDRGLMPASASVLFLIAATNYAILLFSCYGLSRFGPWLNSSHKVDLWLHRVLIQNGVAIYATWTTIAALINLAAALEDSADMSPSDSATVSLSVLTVVLFVWFMVENTVLDKHVRYILSIYPVVIWALTGVFVNNYDAQAPTSNNVFVVSLLGIACAAFVARVGLFIWRQIKHPLYTEEDAKDAVAF